VYAHNPRQAGLAVVATMVRTRSALVLVVLDGEILEAGVVAAADPADDEPGAPVVEILEIRPRSCSASYCAWLRSIARRRARRAR
jgi:hypothetical protein